MKAEKRKELHTNVLADRMGRLVQGMKGGPRATSAGAWVVGAVIVVVGAGWYFAAGSRNKQAEAWRKLDTAVTRLAQGDRQGDTDLSEIIREYPGTLAARSARLQRARQWLDTGLRRVYERASDQRKNAADDLEKARQLFRELAAECANNDLLEPEVLLGQAKAEEALVGIPKKDDAGKEEPGTSRGDLDRALELYRDLAARYPDSFEGQQAQKQVAELEKNREQVEAFYTRINKLETSPRP
jgi:hypothetical protein